MGGGERMKIKVIETVVPAVSTHKNG